MSEETGEIPISLAEELGFITLTDNNTSKTAYVDPSKVQAVFYNPQGFVCVGFAQYSLTVKETPEQVFTKLKEVQ